MREERRSNSDISALDHSADMSEFYRLSSLIIRFSLKLTPQQDAHVNLILMNGAILT